MIVTQPAQWRGVDVDLTTVESRLSDLWKELSAKTEELCPVRTHLFNLVAYARDYADAQRIARLDQLSQRHASRCIIVVPERGGSQNTLDAEISVLSAPGEDGANALFYEQIILIGHGRAGDHLASIVIPLLMPEIPTYLWWPGQPAFGHRFFHQLLATADQLIIDSAQFSNPGESLADVARIAGNVCGVNDFNWSRLTPWREIIAQFFDGPAMQPYVLGIQSARIELGLGKNESDYRRASSVALLVLGWMAAQLGWQPETTLDEELSGDVRLSVLQGERLVSIEISFREQSAESAGRLIGIEIVSQPADGPPAKFRVSRSQDLERIESSVEVLGESAIRRVVPLGIPGDDRLLAEELSLAGHDRLYERVASEASRLAGREIWIPV
jgi:glucose-6-phosphate dehydrogenase assembly protein OpcA